MIRYAKPTSLQEALDLLGQTSWRVLAGGTDFYPALGNRPLRENVLDVNGLADLRGIRETDETIIIGARTTWTDIINQPLPPAFDALKQAAREVGSVQIQNAASIAGNLCNASPAADGVPALLVLDATVEVRSRSTRRTLPLSQFILGNRLTALEPGEMVTAVLVPKTSTAGTSAFHKLGARRYLVISIAMAAARIETQGDGTIRRAAIAVGSCSAVAQRLPGLEAALGGQTVDMLDGVVAAADLAELSPIDDVRGTADYRRAAAREIVLRAIRGAAGVGPTHRAAA